MLRQYHTYALAVQLIGQAPRVQKLSPCRSGQGSIPLLHVITPFSCHSPAVTFKGSKTLKISLALKDCGIFNKRKRKIC